MTGLEQKLSVLAQIARVLNQNRVIWAVGGSLLLYLKGKTDTFHDLDLMVSEAQIETAKTLLSAMGVMLPPNPNAQYKTRHFLEFNIQGVDVDVMAGFVIVCKGREYDCSLLPQQIVEYKPIHGESIPLQALKDWRRYYELMGRTEKVAMIDS